MPDNRHMDPSMDPVRRKLIGETVIELTRQFCACSNRRSIRRLEGAFLQAIRDYGSGMLYTQNLTTAAQAEAEELIDQAHLITTGKNRAEKVTFASEDARLQVLKVCRRAKHQIKTYVCKESLQTYYYCKRCRKEYWLE